MRLVFMGTPDFSVPILEALIEAGHEIACVYTQPPRPAGRGKKETPSPVHERAKALGLSVRTPLNFKDARDQRDFADLNADLAVVVAYGLILPQAVLDAPRRGCLNIHASLLPRWRGAAPIHRAIMAGDRETGICIMQMEAGLDTGPVLHRVKATIAPTDTTGSLHDRLANMGAKAIVDALSNLDALKPVAQPKDEVTYAHKIDKREARIDWSRDASEVDAHIRGLSPFPGAWFSHEEHRIKVLLSELRPGSDIEGRVIDDNLTVACKTGAVGLLKLQRAGKSPSDAAEFLRGHSMDKGTVLTD